MGRWLAKFSAENQESLPDIPDILPSVSGLSGPGSGKSAGNAPPQVTGSLGSGSTIRVGDRIEWERADLTVQHGVVDVLHIDDAGTHWAFVIIAIEDTWAVVNVKFAKGSHA